ncbi:hypothetical protein ACFQS6_00530 [Xanthomonas populi]
MLGFLEAPNRRKLTFLLALAVSLIFLANFANASESGKRAIYLYCNIYTDNSCFGMTPGEHAKIDLPSDFLVYEVEMRGGSKEVVYSGGSPNIQSKSLYRKFEDCTDDDGVCVFLYFQGDVVEAVYSRARNVNSTHLIVKGVSGPNLANVK